MKNALLLIVGLLLKTLAFCQLPYSANTFEYDSIMNLSYGSAIDYAGNNTDLLLDIYKPKGDQNCKRPLIVLVHGGSWVAGSKEDYDLIYLSRSFAKKGWVVANINYRLGTHKAASYDKYLLCDVGVAPPCGYICDSSEVYRANYRGMQDAKGAIRFMKSRNLIDSTDVNNVYIAGESAGGFIALATAFMDLPSEKPASCSAIAAAPTPDPDFSTYGCIPVNNDLSRPDLGSIDGDLHIGTYDASVKGVGNFFGALFNFELLQQATDTPAVYLFHQGSDVIVHHDFDQILGRLSWECFAPTNICQKYNFYPMAHGSKSIHDYFVSLGTQAPSYVSDLVANYSYMNNCFSNGHAPDNLSLRSQNLADFFASQIALSTNNPSTNCAGAGVGELESNLFDLYPNPNSGYFQVRMDKMYQSLTVKIYDIQGRSCFYKNYENTELLQFETALMPGTYLFELWDGNNLIGTTKLIRSE